VKSLLGRWLPNVILKLTDWVAFDAPRIPTKEEVEMNAAIPGGLAFLLDGFRGAAADMNARCNTAGPTASLILTISAVLEPRLDKYEWLYILLLLMAGLAVFAAITGLSIAVPFNRVGLEPDPRDAPAERVALRRKEAWARLSSGMATASLVVLGIAAWLSA
jgi:hypothetical protein